MNIPNEMSKKKKNTLYLKIDNFFSKETRTQIFNPYQWKII